MLPRVIGVSMDLLEVREGSRGKYQPGVAIERDNITGWETVINGVQQVNTPSTQLNYTNHSLAGSHKSIDAKIISDLVLNLVNDELRPIGTLGKEWNLTLDVKIIDSAN